MKTDGNFNYFYNNESKTKQEIINLIDKSTSVSIDGLNVFYSSPKKDFYEGCIKIAEDVAKIYGQNESPVFSKEICALKVKAEEIKKQEATIAQRLKEISDTSMNSWSEPNQIELVVELAKEIKTASEKIKEKQEKCYPNKLTLNIFNNDIKPDTFYNAFSTIKEASEHLKSKDYTSYTIFDGNKKVAYGANYEQENKTEDNYKITTIKVETSPEDRVKIRSIRQLLKEYKPSDFILDELCTNFERDENMNRLIEEELERQEEKVIEDGFNAFPFRQEKGVYIVNNLKVDRPYKIESQGTSFSIEETSGKREKIKQDYNTFENRHKRGSDVCGIIESKELSGQRCVPLPINYTQEDILEAEKKLESLGKKETEGKLNYELDWEFIQQMAERMSQNKDKYSPYNWKKSMDVEKLKQSLFRHVVEVMKGNYSDSDRTYGHLESIALNALFINYQLKNNKLGYIK